ncbi:hypothetical protein BH11MYX2_BH11MYX2_22470 [soil metagenome]
MLPAGEVATRAGLAILAPELAWVALGGWLGALADPGGARSTRVRTVLSFLFYSGIALALVSLTATTVPAAALILAAIVFCGTFGTIVSIVATIT